MSLHARCQKIDLLVVDVDGVLTDGAITYTDQGAECKTFHVRDGSGLKVWMKLGKKTAIITGRDSAMVTRRAAELGITRLVQGADDKLAAFTALLADLNLDAEQAAYLGDDLPDLPVMRRCGLAAAVADACAEARCLAHYVTRAPGGRGAARELIELILHAQGRWQEILTHF